MRNESNGKIKVGSEFDVRIERILPGGVGLAHADGRTIFVALSAPGDLARVRVDQVRGKVAFASIVEVIEPSASRVVPRCVYFGRCGGCDFQQLSYQAQLDSKVEIIRDCLRRIAHLDFQDPIPITPSPNPWQYRSSAQWKYDRSKGQLGYFERGSHNVCDVDECPILVPALQETLQFVRNHIRVGPMPLRAGEFEAVAGDEGVSLFPPFEPDESIDVSRTIGGYRYNFSADAFFQINHELVPALVDAATKDTQGEVALDLYCGAGLFTLPLSRKFARVVGVEAHPRSVDYARRNLTDANLNNAVIECASVGEWLSKDSDSIEPVDLILLDPPRAGVEKDVIERILGLRPARITYVSCDPATLARDLKPLLAGGCALDSIMAFDMFPQTHHIETVAHLTSQWLEHFAKPT